MPKTQLDIKMDEALKFNYDFYVENNRFPKTSEDPYYRSAIRYYKSAKNYRKTILMDKGGMTEYEAETILKQPLNVKTKDDIIKDAIKMFETEGYIWSNTSLVDRYFGTLFNYRMTALTQMGYSREDALYLIKEQGMKTSIPLSEVIKPVVDTIRGTGTVPSSYDIEDIGNIIKRFGRWEVALAVAWDIANNPTLDINEVFHKHRDPYLPNIETLKPIKNFINSNNKLPKSNDIREYRRIVREYILWDNALDEAMTDLGFTSEKKIEYFKER